ncbi:MAG: DUF6585 family protein [Leptolyngbyaceae bacterium]|nr:DUF6585 family protein [Leptolyngbyaceae bacterium]
MHLVSHHDLGNLLGEFGWNKGRAKAVLWLWIFMLLPSLLFSLLIIGLPGLILSIYFIYRSLTRLRATQPVVVLYQQGLVDSRKGTPEIIPYEGIKNIYLSVKVINGVFTYLISLEKNTGQKINLDEHVANIDDLRKLLEDQIVKFQLPGAISTYQQGSPITFNLLQVTQAGLSMGKKMLPWSEFGTAEIQRVSNTVYLTIRQKDSNKEWGRQPRGSFPNLALFFEIVKYVQENQNHQ